MDDDYKCDDDCGDDDDDDDSCGGGDYHDHDDVVCFIFSWYSWCIQSLVNGKSLHLVPCHRYLCLAQGNHHHHLHQDQVT